MNIIKQYKLTYPEILKLLSLILDHLDSEFLNLLRYAERIGYFDVHADNSLPLELLREFLKNLNSKTSISAAQSKLKAIIEGVNFHNELIHLDKNEVESTKELFKMKLRSFIVFSATDRIVKSIISMQENPIIESDKVWKNISDLEKELEQVRIDLSFLSRRYNEFEFNTEKGDVLDIYDEVKPKRINSPIPYLIDFFESKRLYLIAGVAKAGKSFFALNLMERFWFDGHNVLFISLENTLRELINRFLVLLNYRHNLTGKDLTLNDLDIDRYRNKIISGIKKKKQTNSSFKVIEAPLVNLPVMIQMLQENSQFDIIFIDWIDLISVSKSSNLFLDYGNVVRELFNFAREQNKIIIGITQLNREALDSEVKNSKYMSRSWAKVETADVVLIIDKMNDNQLLATLDFARYLSCPKQKILDIDYSRAFVNF